jgi:CHAT domain-containing protein
MKGADVTSFAVESESDGLLYVEIRELGQTVQAAVAGGNRAGAMATAAMNRLGVIHLTQRVAAGNRRIVQIRGWDSPDVTGTVCASAALVQPAESALARAFELSAAADAAAYRLDWQEAFRDHLAAARLYDRLERTEAADTARHAMAFITANYVPRERDSLALTAGVLAHPALTSPLQQAARLKLRAEVLLEKALDRDVSADAVHRLLASSARLFRGSTHGRRELPRLATLEGLLEYRIGHTSEAQRLFAEAASQCEALRDSECFALAQQNLSAVAQEQQNFSAALAGYEKALGAVDATRLPRVAAIVSDNLGRLAGRMGLVERSEQAHRSAMQLYARVGDCDGARHIASSLGEMLGHVGSVADATEYLVAATTLGCPALLQAVTAPGSPGLSAAPASAVAPSAAAACSQRPVRGDLTLEGDAAVFRAFLELSQIARSEGDLPGAQACLTLARTYAVEARTRVLLANANGGLQLEERRAGAALRAFEEALRLASDGALPESSEYQGVARLGVAATELLAGRTARARSSAYSALALASAHADVNRIVASLELLASADSAAGRRDLSVRTLHTAIALLEQVPTDELDAERRATYLATQHAVFAELTDVLVLEASSASIDQSPQRWAAFAAADEAHARSLRLALEQTARERAPQDATRSSEYRGLLRAIAAASQPDRALSGSALLERVTQLAEPQRSPDFDRDSLVRELGELDASLVEYATGRDTLYAFIVDRGELRIVTLGSRQTIARAASDLGAELRSPEPRAALIEAAARRLAQLALWPLRPYLTRQRIMFVPDDALHTVPFAVLPWTEAPDSELVLHRAEVSTIPSALLIARRMHQPSLPPRFVLLGDPVLHGVEWRRSCAAASSSLTPLSAAERATFEWTRSLPNLPGSRTEVLRVSDLMRRTRPAAGIETLLQCQATAAALRTTAPDAEVLHVATHGLIDARRPRLSALALTPDSESADDAALRLLDIIGLKLTARLVVLSACETSRGKLLPGEGVLGLAQAFLQAGAATVVASYWRVEDADTAPFMEAFYRHMLVDRMPAAAALRRTQLERARNDRLYQWAAFSVYGRPDTTL